MDGTITIGTEINTKGVEDGVKNIQDIVESKQPEIDLKVNEQSKGMKGISNLATKIASKFTGISASTLKFVGSIGKLVGGLGLVVGLVGAIAIAGVGLAGAFDKALEKDKELKAQLESIKTALANAFLPIAEKIINVIKTMLYYLGYVLKAWFGINIFAKNNTKNMNKAVKSAKALNKQLAGFDEMNILSDNSNAGGGAGGGYDLKDLDKIDVPKWIKWIADLKDKLVNLAKWIYNIVIKPIVNGFVWLWNRIKEIFSPFVLFFKSIFTTMWDNIKITIENIAKIFVWLWDRIKDIFAKVGEILNPFINAIVGLWDKVKGALKKFGVKVGEVIGNAFKVTFNGIMKVIETFLNAPIKAINGLIKVINEVPGINLTKLKEFKLPRLAQGGIVHNPGKGVLMGNYIAGEGRDSEAVIPLNDATMDRLGESIARHMNINNENKIYLNARQIARQMNITNAENNFAYNG